MHYYIARVVSISTGAVLWYPGEWFRKLGTSAIGERVGLNKRNMRKMARESARGLKMAGPLKVSIMRSKMKASVRLSGKPVELAADFGGVFSDNTVSLNIAGFHSGGVIDPGKHSAPPMGAEYVVPNAQADIYAKAAASVFPVKVVRVTPQEDPAYKSVRFHVKGANGKTVKNCKTLKEAEETAHRINFAEGVKDRCDALTDPAG